MPGETHQTTALPGPARAAVAQLPRAPGVYRFRDGQQRALYIGRAADLRRRVGSYWSSPGDDRRSSDMVERIARIEAVVCDSEHEAVWLERNLLEQKLPRWNKTAGGQEVPVWIRLSWQSATPGLSVVHAVHSSAEACHFGPYLGGHKVRIQAEVDGFDWVVSAQRATVSESEDVDVYGWADGILVHFRVVSGRLCTWRQRPCTEAAAQPRVSITPASWAYFARRNAELAARLSS